MREIDLNKPAQWWNDPGEIIVTEDGKCIKELQTVDECVAAIAYIKRVANRITEMQGEEASNRIYEGGSSRPRNPERNDRLRSHYRNVKTALQNINLKNQELATAAKAARKEKNMAENEIQENSEEKTLLYLIKGRDYDAYMQAVAEARQRRPDLFD